MLEAADVAGLLVEQLLHRRRLGPIVDGADRLRSRDERGYLGGGRVRGGCFLCRCFLHRYLSDGRHFGRSLGDGRLFGGRIGRRDLDGLGDGLGDDFRDRLVRDGVHGVGQSLDGFGDRLDRLSHWLDRRDGRVRHRLGRLDGLFGGCLPVSVKHIRCDIGRRLGRRDRGCVSRPHGDAVRLDGVSRLRLFDGQ